MAQCIACEADIAVYEHRCPECGAKVPRGGVRSSIVRYQARLSHLLALPGMLVFLVSFPVVGTLALAPLNVIVPLIYRWCHPKSSTIRTHATEVLNFQVLWTAAVAVLWLLAEFSSPMEGDPWWSTATYYMLPDQLFVVEFPSAIYEWTPRGMDADLDDQGSSSWVLATMAYGLLSVTWLGGIALSVFLAYDLGNGGSGRYPLRIPVFRSE